MKSRAPQASGKASALATGMWVAGSLVGLYLAVGVLFLLDVRICRTHWNNTFPGFARVGLIKAYTPFLRTLRLAGVLPPVMSPVQRLRAEILAVREISVHTTAGGCAAALGAPRTATAAMGKAK